MSAREPLLAFQRRASHDDPLHESKTSVVWSADVRTTSAIVFPGALSAPVMPVWGDHTKPMHVKNPISQACPPSANPSHLIRSSGAGMRVRTYADNTRG